MLNKILSLLLISIFFNQSASADIDNFKRKYAELNKEEKEEIISEFKRAGWWRETSSDENDIYINFKYIKPLPYDQVEAWVKYVVYNDIKKDGLAIGDYTMFLNKYNCSNRTVTSISYAEYNNKTGNLLKAYTYPSYTSARNIIPETIGESILDAVCLLTHIKRN